jgi:chorismate mutase
VWRRPTLFFISNLRISNFEFEEDGGRESSKFEIRNSQIRNPQKGGQMEQSNDGWKMRCRGVRGATVAREDTREEIHAATRELVAAMIEANDIEADDLASALFTTSPDLRASHPAEAARLMGWVYVPMLGAVEMDKLGGLERCIRVLLHWNTAKGQREIKHIYLRGTESLRTVGDGQAESIATRKDGAE